MWHSRGARSDIYILARCPDLKRQRIEAPLPRNVLLNFGNELYYGSKISLIPIRAHYGFPRADSPSGSIWGFIY